ncbi:hypothetical protein A0J57_12790 [Sphingobium sp. 22B]|uniref:hypothetical protein n=1 Tax=unclassified Sphingobium TaxID=2611147 RepID=UPI0007811F36|nr:MULTISPECIES: hypothetical protein [unclassified Sphingobium]KXU31938.1 hypothetical protein AXW74_09695 [Sphingobium sp. AM]KYC31916.1 hypothetical protein A0J57_12790 [Sphingobium sp. 22B]OAP31725.1 hypothetical protein A8O16_11660 [Sphingobium sp. 20006FA]UXC90956.1 hypothetical protein EGM87_00215 [Sphingobium sp. RSMS]
MRKRIIFTLGIFTRGTFTLAICTLGLAPALPTHAQDYRDLRRATDAAIASDIARDRQAERDARRQPYVSPGYGPIQTATAARNACAAKAREEAGPGAKVLGRIAASTMSTGWEVEGEVGPFDGRRSVPFVCSVRNGSVSGILLQPDR